MTLDSRPGDQETRRPEDRMIRYKRNSKTISGRLHEEMIMMDIDQGKYFSLNPVATRIWDFLEHEMDVEELCGKLMEEYEVRPEQCREEVIGYLGDMIRLGLVFETRSEAT
jgi:hypothetical protein